MITIKQYRSVIRVCEKQKKIVERLGLRKIGAIKKLPDNPCIWGMIKKVPHIVEVIKEDK